MSLSMEEGPLKEAAIFTRAVENVFRKLIRLLLGRMTLTRLQEMIRAVYIEEAELKLKRERPGKNVPLSRLALMTGLDTRTLNKYLDENQSDRSLYNEDRFLKAITPESSVLDFWATKSEYRNSVDGAPLKLPLRGPAPSFEALVGEISISRGVTMSSVLDRLEKSESIRVDPDSQLVEMLSSRFLPFSKRGLSEALEVGFVTVGYLVDTLVHNLEKKSEGDVAFFQRSNWTTRLSRAQLSVFRSKVRHYLSEAETGAIQVIEQFEDQESKHEQVTAGVSFFYFEENATD